MQRLDEAESSAVREAVRRFLHADCIGCRFAQNFIKTGEGASWVIFVGDLSASVGDDLTAVLDQAAQSGELAY